LSRYLHLPRSGHINIRVPPCTHSHSRSNHYYRGNQCTSRTRERRIKAEWKSWDLQYVCIMIVIVWDMTPCILA